MTNSTGQGHVGPSHTCAPGAESRIAGRSSTLRFLIASALLVMLQTASAQNIQTTQDTLLDRIQIEDLLNNYYSDMASGRDLLSEYYVADGVLDVNGIVYQGHAEIQSAYAQAENAPLGRMNMLMNNPRIRVHGATATADTIWTGIMNDSVRLAPRLYEQGREHDELVKSNGRWYFSRRVITSDSGLPERYDATYQER